MAVDHNNPQSRDEEILIATIDGEEYNKNPQSRMEELLLELKETIEEGGGGGGTTNYENLSNQPQVNGETLIGDKSGADLGLVDAEEGKGLSTNDYDDTEKAAVAAATSAITAMKDGSELDSFGDVEVALLDKADISDLGTAAAKNSTNAVTSGSTDLVESGAVKDAIDYAVSRAYHHAGTKTVAQLTHDLLIAANEGNVYEMTDSGTTTSDFMEGIGRPIKEGDNVGVARVSEGVYKFDLLSGFVDTSNFVQKSETAGLLKNDGTVDTTIQGDVSTLKSGLTNLDNEVNGDAVVYPYADVITIEDAVPSNLADCNVKIEPVQDLHGYDHPWVGGAGDNKYSVLVGNDDWGNNASATHSTGTSGELIVSCGSNANSGVYSGAASVLKPEIVSLGTCYVSFDISASASCSIKVRFGDGTDRFLDVTASKIRVNQQITPIDGTFVFYGNGNVVDLTISNFMISTTSGEVYEPYSNICPITGHTEADVQRDGKNHFDVNGSYINRQGAGGTYTVSGNSITVKSSTKTSAFAGFIKPLEVGETYAISYTSTSKIRIIQIDEPISVITQGYYGTDTDSGTSFVASKPYVLINCVGDTSGVTYSNIQLEKGSSATDYEPYQGKTYTIALGDTIYGGSVDFNTGLMTVTHQYVTKNTSTMNNLEQYPGWTGSGIKQIVGSGIDDVVSTCVNVSDVIRANTLNINDILFFEKNDIGLTQTELIALAIDVAFVVELATPTTIQLTPQQIQLLKGTNTLTASTGDISVTVNGVSGSIGAVQEQVNELAETVTNTQTTIQGSINAIEIDSSYTFDVDEHAKAFTIIVNRYGIADSITVIYNLIALWNNNNELYFVMGGSSNHVILKMNYNDTTKKCTATVKESTIAGIADTAVYISVVTMY